MKILLINPPDENKVAEFPDERGKDFIGSSDFGHFPPLGLLYVLSHLEKYTTGHELFFKDCVAEQVSHVDLRQLVATIDPDIVGITSFTVSLIDVLMAACNIREVVPKAHITLGGHHSIAFPIEAARLEEFDSVIVGEGEVAFTELVCALNNSEDITQIKGLYTKDSVESWVTKKFDRDKRFLQHVTLPPTYIEDIDSIPPPNRKYIQHINYGSIIGVSSKLATIISSRGCPYKCTFCDVPFKEYRKRSPKLVVDEIESALVLGYGEFHFYDDLFNIKPQSVIDICDEIDRRNLNITWDFRGRVNGVNYESLQRFKNSGGRMISFGIETSSDEGLKVLRKGSKSNQNKMSLKWCRELGIETVADYMVGLPHERSADDIKRSVKTLIGYDPDYAQFGVLSLYPNTEVYDQAVNKGLIEDGKWNEWVQNPTSDFVVDHWNEFLTTKELIKLQKWSYRKFYFRLQPILRMIYRLRSVYEFKTKLRGAFKILGLRIRGNERHQHLALK